MGINTVYRIAFVVVVPLLTLAGLVELAGAAAVADPEPEPVNVAYSPPMAVTVTIPTPFPTPAPITTETITNTIISTGFWDIENYQRPVSVVQTIFLLPAVADILQIIMRVGAVFLSLKLLRAIIAITRSGKESEV